MLIESNTLAHEVILLFLTYRVHLAIFPGIRCETAVRKGLK